MGLYVAVAGGCLLLVPVAWWRSRSMTRYVVVTGAPVVWVLLGVASVAAALVHRADPSTAQQLFLGGLLGTAFVQVTLLRRTLTEVSRPDRDDPREG